MPASKSEKLSGNNLLIVLLLITLLVMGGSGLAIKMLVGTISRDLKVVGKEKIAVDKIKKDVENAPILMGAYEALGSQKALLADALPNTVDFPGIIVTMENMANVAGSRLKSVTPLVAGSDATASDGSDTQNSAATGAQPYRFSVTLDGTYAGLQTFLQGVEQSARPMRVVTMQLSGSGSALSSQIDIETYYQDKAKLPFGTEEIK